MLRFESTLGPCPRADPRFCSTSQMLAASIYSCPMQHSQLHGCRNILHSRCVCDLLPTACTKQAVPSDRLQPVQVQLVTHVRSPLYRGVTPLARGCSCDTPHAAHCLQLCSYPESGDNLGPSRKQLRGLRLCHHSCDASAFACLRSSEQCIPNVFWESLFQRHTTHTVAAQLKNLWVNNSN